MDNIILTGLVGGVLLYGCKTIRKEMKKLNSKQAKHAYLRSQPDLLKNYSTLESFSYIDKEIKKRVQRIAQCLDKMLYIYTLHQTQKSHKHLMKINQISICVQNNMNVVQKYLTSQARSEFVKARTFIETFVSNTIFNARQSFRSF